MKFSSDAEKLAAVEVVAREFGDLVAKMKVVEYKLKSTTDGYVDGSTKGASLSVLTDAVAETAKGTHVFVTAATTGVTPVVPVVPAAVAATPAEAPKRTRAKKVAAEAAATTAAVTAAPSDDGPSFDEPATPVAPVVPAAPAPAPVAAPAAPAPAAAPAMGKPANLEGLRARMQELLGVVGDRNAVIGVLKEAVGVTSAAAVTPDKMEAACVAFDKALEADL